MTAHAIDLPTSAMTNFPTIIPAPGRTSLPRSDESVFVFPAALAQRRSWLLEKWRPQNLTLLLEFSAGVAHSQLQHALELLAERHEILRTTFASSEGRLQQIIAQRGAVDLTISAQSNVASVRAAELKRSFDLTNGPLWRATVIRRTNRSDQLLLTIHAAITDFRSNEILAHDLRALLAGENLRPLPLQFADYAEWQSEQLAAGNFSSQHDFWRDELAGKLSQLHCKQTRESSTQVATITHSFEFAAAEHADASSLFLAAFQSVLHRHGAGDNFVIFLPVENRARGDFQSLLGPLENLLPLRADFRGVLTFADSLGRADSALQNARENEDIPFEALLDEIQIPRTAICFRYLESESDAEQFPPSGYANLFALTAIVRRRNGAAELVLEYDPARLDRTMLERMSEDFEKVLSNALADPQNLISRLPVDETPNAAGNFPANEVQSERTAEAIRPYLGLQLQLIAIWEELLATSGLGIRDNFFELGGTPLLALRMLQRAETVCGRNILPAKFFRDPTIETLANEITRDLADNAPVLLRVNETGERTPFFYLHGDLFGGGFYSLKLSRELGTEQPFFVLPPHDVRALTSAVSIEEMATAHLAALRAARPHGPYVIGGFCLGGVVAFELAQQIVASGEEVQMLLIIDATPRDKMLGLLRRLTSRFARFSAWNNFETLAAFGGLALRRAQLTLWFDLNIGMKIRVALRQFFNQTIGAFRLLKGNPIRPAASPEAADLAREADVPAAFLWAAAGYRPRPYSGAITLLLSEDLFGVRKIERAWRRLAPRLSVHALPGSHLECITAHVETLARTMQQNLPTTIARGDLR